MTHGLFRLLTAAAMSLGALALSGCESLQAGNTHVVLGLLEKKVVPPTMQMSDVDMGCAFALANTPLIASTRAFYADPSMLESVQLLAAGGCAEQQALDEELRYMRAQRDKRPDEALDARTSQKRMLQRAALRQLGAFDRMRGALEKKYKFTYGQSCPRFRKDFDELVYLLGTVAGLQAFSNDVAAQQVVGVPSDIAPKAEFAMTCLSNTKWWGVPLAARAAVWSLVPGGSEGKDVNASFDLAMGIGEREGVRVAHVMAAVAAVSADNQDRIRYLLRRFTSVKYFQPNADYRFVDESAVLQMQNISDRMWTLNTGMRTPVGKLGKFWDDKAAGGANVDGFLN